MAPTNIVPNLPVSPRPQTPPSSPELPTYKQALTVKDARRFLELLRTQATQTVPALGEAPQPVETEEISGEKQHVAARASKLELRTVSEIWDPKTY